MFEVSLCASTPVMMYDQPFAVLVICFVANAAPFMPD